MKTRLLFPFLLLFAGPLSAQPLTALDSTFAQDGILYVDTPVVAGKSRMALAPDGRIVTVNAYNYNPQPFQIGYALAIRRFLPDGTPDITFGGNGGIRVPIAEYSTAFGIRVQSDHKLVVLSSTGYFQGTHAELMRFHPDGRPDSSFNGTGRITIQHTTQDGLFDLELQPDGKALVTGSYTESNMHLLAIRRFDTSGRPDSSFGYFGVLHTALPMTPDFGGTDICLQPDGKLIITGTSLDLSPSHRSQFTVARYVPEGLLDTSFHFGDGFVTRQFAGVYWSAGRTAAVRPDGKILVAGIATYRYEGAAFATLLQLRADGRIDSSWGNNGVMVVDTVLAGIVYHIPDIDLKVTANNKILVSFGHADTITRREFAVYRLLPDGSRDASFGLNGMVTTSLSPKHSYAEELMVQPDGKILVCGQYEDAGFQRHLGLVRYRPDVKLGVKDLPRLDYGLSLYPNPAAANSRLTYQLTGTETVSVDIWDETGRRVRNALPPTRQPKGSYSLPLQLGEGLAAGIYFVTLKTATGFQAVKLLKP